MSESTTRTADLSSPAPRQAAVPFETVEDFAASSAPESSSAAAVQSQPEDRGPGVVLFDFHDDEPAWYTVDDIVMGGVSASSASVDLDRRRLTFSGNVSLDNNGGFASIRSPWAGYDLRAFDGIALRVRGDGSTYRFRIRTEDTGSEIAYTSSFTAPANQWQEVFLPFAEMVPTYRGYVVGEAGPLNASAIRSFGLMIADKQQGEFLLEVDWINAVAVKKAEIKSVRHDARG